MYTIKQIGAELGVGRNSMFKLLYGAKMLHKSDCPQHSLITGGWFVVKSQDEFNPMAIQVTYVTELGRIKILEYFKSNGGVR